jgi:uncharacterized protein YwgA
MDRRQIALRLTLDVLRLDFKIDDFTDRLILQKAVYLVQAGGVHLGYYYQWYLHGPYSPSLTRDEYAVAEELGAGLDESESWTLDEQSEAKLQNLRGLVDQREDQSCLARELELLASVHFLITRDQIVDEDEQIAAALQRFGKEFHKRDVQRARGELQSYGLL